MQLGKAIRIVRNGRNRNGKSVAQAADIGGPMLSLIESGERQPSKKTLGKIAEALDVPVELFTVITDPKTPLVEPVRSRVADLLECLTEIDRAERSLLNEIQNHKLWRA